MVLVGVVLLATTALAQPRNAPRVDHDYGDHYFPGWISSAFLDHGGQVVNVKAFGAKGDGTTNDKAAIDRAVNAAGIGGTVQFPKGTYRINSRLVPLANQTFAGQGRGSILKATDGSTWGDSAAIDLGTDGPVNGVTIRDLVLDGNKAVNPTGRMYGIECGGCTDLTLHNVVARNHPDNGVGNGGDGLVIGKSGTTRPERITVSQCDFDGNVRQGISITSGKNIRIKNSTLRNTSGNNPGAGIDIEPNAAGAADAVEDVIIAGSTIEGNEKGIIIPNPNQATIRNITIADSIVRDNRGAGLILQRISQGDAVTVDNVKVYNNALEGVQIGSNSNVGSITVSDSFIAKNGREGVEITSTRRFILRGNTIILNGEHGVSIGFVFSGDLHGALDGNTIQNNGTSASNTYDGVNFAGNATHPNFATQVDRNLIGNDTTLGTATQRHGLRLEANAQNIRLGHANRFSGHLGLGISTASGGLIVPEDGTVLVTDFGAKGDGAADDTTAIRAAETACSAAGCTLVFPGPATYLISDELTYRSHQRWTATGGAILKLANASVANLIRTVSGSTVAGMVQPAASAQSNVRFEGLILDGNKANNSTTNSGDGLNIIDQTDVEVRGVTVRKVPRDGLTVGESASGVTANVRIVGYVADDVGLAGVNGGSGLAITSGDDIEVDGPYIESSERDGIDIEPNASRVVRRVTVRGGHLINNALTGFRIDPNAGGNNSVVNATAIGVQAALNVSSGFYVAGPDLALGTAFIGNTAYRNSEHGFYFEDQEIVRVIGNVAIENGQATANTFSGFYVDRANFSLIGNDCYDNQGTKTQKYCIEEDAGASSNDVCFGSASAHATNRYRLGGVDYGNDKLCRWDGGTPIIGHLAAGYALNLAAPGASPGCVDSAAQTLTGVALSDGCTASLSVNRQTGQTVECFVNAANQVTFRVCDLDGAATDPDGAGATYSASVWKR